VALIDISTSSNGLLTVTLTRPEAKNALNIEMVRLFREALVRGVDGKPPRVILLKSGVAGVFSIGMDLASLEAGINSGATSPEVYEATREYVALLKDIVTARCLTIAVVDGVAVGGGVDLASACDFLFASERAAFSVAQLRKGIFPLTTSGVVVPRIGERAFMYWALSGQNWSSKKALKMGLATQIWPAAEMTTRVEQFVEQVLGYNREALQLGIDALRMHHGMRPEDRLEHLGALLALNCQIPRASRNTGNSGKKAAE
jgi:enoyl-CoA hydratase/carnithine racemase